MSKRETAELDRQGRGRARKAKRSNPKFEIVYEDPAPVGLWARLKQAVEPAANVVRDVLGGTYVVAARTVLERVEQIEDARAARFSRRAPKAETEKAEPVIAIEGPATGKANAPKTRRTRTAAAPVEGASEDVTAKPARAPRKPRTAASAEATVAQPRRSGRRATRTRT